MDTDHAVPQQRPGGRPPIAEDTIRWPLHVSLASRTRAEERAEENSRKLPDLVREWIDAYGQTGAPQ